MIPEITDKLGRPSALDHFAEATTVSAGRTVGETVLACFDLSNFAEDTPVYFATYKKTVDPISGAVTITNQTGWKALVNIDGNSLTNLTIAPGYTDIGNSIGDYVECIPLSHWGNSLVDFLLESHNQDGSTKPVSEVKTIDTVPAILEFSTAATQPEPVEGKIIVWFEPLA